MMIEWMMYADGPGSSKRRTVHTIAEETHPHDAMHMRRLDHVDGFNEQGVRRGRWITVAADQSATAADEELSLSLVGWG